MKIGFDAKRAFKNRTGLGNYSRSLIEALHQYFPQHQYQLFTPLLEGKPSLFDEAFDMKSVRVVQARTKFLSSFWRTFRVPSLLHKKGVQLYHGLSAELPAGTKPKGVPYVVTIHDLIFLRFPELYPAMDRKIYGYKTRAACEKADMIIAISEQTKQDLISYLQVPAEKITVVYQTCNPVFERSVSEVCKKEISQKYHLPERFILCVGTLEARKNALLLLKSLLHLPKEVNVVLVGKPTEYQKKIEAYIKEHHLENRVWMLPQVSFDDLPVLYQLASIFVYPSIFEGFGIPVIEALKSGVPVIAATGSCLEEAGGPDSLYVRPDDDFALAQHIAALWDDEDFRQAQIEKGLTFAQKFSLKDFAAHTMQVYQTLV
ncbi:glycosyltransferase family 1 protein [Taibaiella sp. KBW10]|uniref:glycosyltransferase family 4 protein n=1 Tax=Taibaiella sp. KBW10 TaxID=2153357 RepID=UPI000F5A5EFE|nr:glycosyltransferase family 1 protein [Taibaiella sp. KBW10]RQO31759.1 glycosyltransferase family 1 protein [Taibaiella sp. KBW10]